MMGKVLIVMVGLETTFVFALTSSFLIIGALRTIPPPGSLALGTLSLVGLTLGVHGLLALVGGMVARNAKGDLDTWFRRALFRAIVPVDVAATFLLIFQFLMVSPS